MGKKQYTRPEVQAYQVNPSEVICGSGDSTASMPTGKGNPTQDSSGNFTGNSASSRSGWEEYEGRW